jgi:ribonuclease PH
LNKVRGTQKGIPIKNYIVSVTVGYQKDILLDVNYYEEQASSVLLLVCERNQNQWKLLGLDGEDRIPFDQLEEMIQVGMQGCEMLYLQMDELIRKEMIQ